MTPGHLLILQSLADFGPTKAALFVEGDLDFLFRMRPRLVALVRGFLDPVVEITAEGRKVLVAARPTG